MQRQDQTSIASARTMESRPKMDIRRIIGPHGSVRVRVRQLEFPSTVEADPVGAAFDRKHTAQMAVPASENELEKPWQFHKSCARWRRSQLPLASSHSSRVRTLARARAIAQSAAP
jgi:hypothetical protein